jgi:hypothetical protein
MEIDVKESLFKNKKLKCYRLNHSLCILCQLANKSSESVVQNVALEPYYRTKTIGL